MDKKTQEGGPFWQKGVYIRGARFYKKKEKLEKTDRLIPDQPESVDVRFVSSRLFDRLVYYRND